MADRILELISRINSPEIQAKLIFLKIPFIVVTICFVGFIVYVIFKTYWIHVSFIEDSLEFITYRPVGFHRLGKRWRQIMARLETGNEAEWKLAIIEADTILDETLHKMNMEGTNVDERLKKLTSIAIPNIEELQNAHQVRSNIVYDPDYRLSIMDARRALAAYEKAFQSLDLLS